MGTYQVPGKGKASGRPEDISKKYNVPVKSLKPTTPPSYHKVPGGGTVYGTPETVSEKYNVPVESLKPVTPAPTQPPPVNPLVQEAINKLGGTTVDIYYRTPSGQIKVMETNKAEYYLSNLPGEFLNMNVVPLSGGTGKAYTYTKGNQQIIFDIREQILATPSEKEQYGRTGIIPIKVREQVNLSEDIKQKLRAAGKTEAQIQANELEYERIAYMSYLGMDVVSRETSFNESLNRQIQIKQPIKDVKQLASERWAELGKQEYGSIKQASLALSSSYLAIYDINYWLSEDKQQYFAERQAQAVQEIQSGEAWKTWAGVQVPAYENVIIPLATFEGLGYIKGLGPTGAKISSGIMKSLGLYTAKNTYEGGVEAYKSGNLPEYVATQGVLFSAYALIGGKAYKEGELLGTRKAIISNATTPVERARLTTLFKAIDYSRNIPSSNAKVFDISKVTKLQDKFVQQQNLKVFLKKSPYKKKLVLGGSASQSTYLEGGRTPADIDILVKPGRLTINLRPLVSDVSSTESMLPSYEKLSISRPSLVDVVKSEMGKYNIDTSLYDIHDLPKVGSSFAQLGTGFAERPIKTPEGSLFKYQMTLSEQAGRKFASAYNPLHTLRGKDWIDVINIAAEKMDTDTTGLLKNYMPELKPGTYEMIGKSYYGLNPGEAPKSNFTWFERQLRRYGSEITTKKLFSTEAQAFLKPGAEPFRPQLISKITVPSWAKGTIFLSVGVPVSDAATNDYLSSLGVALLPGYLSLQKPSSYAGASNYPQQIITKMNYPSYIDDTSYFASAPISSYPSSLISHDYISTPSYPSPPSYPGKTNYLISPNIPTYPTHPSKKTYPKYPTYPTYPKYPYYPPYNPPIKTTKRKRPEDDIMENMERIYKGFNVLIKEQYIFGGVKTKYPEYKRINVQPLTKESAYSLLATHLKQTARASGMIEATEGRPTKQKSAYDWMDVASEFYEKQGVIIQKASKRIGTPGELKEITYKGIAARRKR